ncbi:MAG: hypothetical protein J3Q66DRAFT_441512 [Benniella sp.]|nr:MAG: hypothetical protein J3Q66DRAFT_441512 [Benniella sp.]
MSEVPSQLFRTQSSSKVVSIPTRLDTKSGTRIVLWRDVQRFFEHAKYIMCGQDMVLFLTDDDFEELVPQRIAHYPGVALVVLMQNEDESSYLSMVFHPAESAQTQAVSSSTISASMGNDVIATRITENSHALVARSQSISEMALQGIHAPSAHFHRETESNMPQQEHLHQLEQQMQRLQQQMEQVHDTQQQMQGQMDGILQNFEKVDQLMQNSQQQTQEARHQTQQQMERALKMVQQMDQRLQPVQQQYEQLQQQMEQAHQTRQQMQGQIDEVPQNFEKMDQLIQTSQQKTQDILQRMHQQMENVLQTVQQVDQMLQPSQQEHKHYLQEMQDMKKVVQHQDHLSEQRCQETIQVVDQFAPIQYRVQGILTRSYQKLPIPRLFILLPELTGVVDGQGDSSSSQFRLYFLCECGTHTMGNTCSEPHMAHLTEHPGYKLRLQNSFIRNYGSHILAMMCMVKYGAKIEGLVIPPLLGLNDATEGNEDHEHLQLIKNISRLVDDTITHLVEATGTKESDTNPATSWKLDISSLARVKWYLKTNDMDANEYDEYGKCDERDGYDEYGEYEHDEYDEYGEYEHDEYDEYGNNGEYDKYDEDDDDNDGIDDDEYMYDEYGGYHEDEEGEGDNKNNKDNESEEDRSIGDLHRAMTQDGHCVWICSEHKRDYYDCTMQRFAEIITSQGGTYSEANDAIDVSSISNRLEKLFYDAIARVCWIQNVTNNQYLTVLSLQLDGYDSISKARSSVDILINLDSFKSLRLKFERLSIQASTTPSGFKDVTLAIEWLRDLSEEDFELIQNCQPTRLEILHTPDQPEEYQLVDILQKNHQISQLSIECREGRSLPIIDLVISTMDGFSYSDRDSRKLRLLELAKEWMASPDTTRRKDIAATVHFTGKFFSCDVEMDVVLDSQQLNNQDAYVCDLIRRYGWSIKRLIIQDLFNDHFARLLDDITQERGSRITYLDCWSSSLTGFGLGVMGRVISRSNHVPLVRMRLSGLHEESRLEAAIEFLGRFKNQVEGLYLLGDAITKWLPRLARAFPVKEDFPLLKELSIEFETLQGSSYRVEDEFSCIAREWITSMLSVPQEPFTQLESFSLLNVPLTHQDTSSLIKAIDLSSLEVLVLSNAGITQLHFTLLVNRIIDENGPSLPLRLLDLSGADLGDYDRASALRGLRETAPQVKVLGLG